jgi:phage gp29-like protein
VVDSDTGHILTPEMVMLAQAELFQNGSVFVIPFGAEVTPIYVQGNGEAFLKGFDFLDRQMVHGILGQTRATMEAEHGSKADSEQGDSILNLLTTYGRDLFGEVIRNMILKQFVALNWNQEVADLYTPYVYFGSVNPKNTVAMWNALSNAKKVGLLTASTEQEWCARADAPIPDPEVDQAAQKAQMEQEAKIAGKPQDAPGGPSGGGNDGSDQEDQENAYRASAGSTRWWNLRNRRGLFSGYRKTG